MAETFSNLNFKRIILHNVYPPNDEGQVKPFCSTVLTQLDHNASQKLEERLTSVLGSSSHSLQMNIAQDGKASCFHFSSQLLDASDSDFIKDSCELANLHTSAHTNKSWPGGTLVIIDGTSGAANRRCLFIIKAEQQAGFIESQEGNTIKLSYIENLILTPQARLYKVGVFVEQDDKSLADEIRDKDEFEAYVFDSNIKAKDDRNAAKYFYSSFLGLQVPENAEQRTRDFFEYSREYVNGSQLPDEKKIDVQQALHTYLKTDQSNTIQASEFAEKYLPEEFRDDYNDYVVKKGFPVTAVVKDTSLIKRKLAIRKMSFSSDVKLTAPAEKFSELVRIIEATDDHTIIQVKGKLSEQDK
ncbi:hypothetical protein CEG15_13225 [Vibrio anguillarum]|uniref:nucleoid-associated protein n=1 Tax=Vibrio anguillarum TaxID=55601 RepID=UPI000B53C908|nr:nucleoid-associated protein [Vibrio anguillarum]ASG01081.1 hypothetical protein CEG15_13225 [Vibrio anguillarum]